MQPWTKVRSDLANAIKRGDDEQTQADLRRDLRAARLQQSIREAVDAWPPLTVEQRAELAALLRPAPDTHQTF